MRTRLAYLPVAAVLAVLAYLGINAEPTSFVGSLFAAFLSAFVVLFVEMELRPSLAIVQERNPATHTDGRKFLRVFIINRPLWWPLGLCMDRRAATQVRAWVTFLTESNDPVFAPERKMIARWSNTPEPVRPITVVQSGTSVPQVGFAWDLGVTRDAVDIGSGSREPLDIVVRAPAEDGCRGWHNRIISNPNLRPEDQYELPKGRYRALVEADVSGRRYRAMFRIVCDVGIGDFRLESIKRLPKL